VYAIKESECERENERMLRNECGILTGMHPVGFFLNVLQVKRLVDKGFLFFSAAILSVLVSMYRCQFWHRVSTLVCFCDVLSHSQAF
jgi:hypothetical protein